MIYQIQTINNPKLEKFYEDSMAELDSFFKLNWKRNRPNLILIPDRKTINALKGKETENWVVGWTEKTNIYLLSNENYEKESNHKYSDEEYRALIKHELTHCFSDIITGSNKKPVWLLEGISIFLSGQNKFKFKTKPNLKAAILRPFEFKNLW